MPEGLKGEDWEEGEWKVGNSEDAHPDLFTGEDDEHAHRFLKDMGQSEGFYKDLDRLEKNDRVAGMFFVAGVAAALLWYVLRGC